MRSILVIEDRPDEMAEILKLLPSEEIRVSTATNGSDGLKLLGDETIDLVIIDHFLPDLDSIEFLRVSKRLLKPCPPVLIVTKVGEEYLVPIAKNAGAVDVLIKDALTSEILQGEIRSILAKQAS